MRDPLFVAARAAADARKATDLRNEAIRAARAEGRSLREIADIVGMSPQAVDNICKRTTLRGGT